MGGRQITARCVDPESYEHLRRAPPCPDQKRRRKAVDDLRRALEHRRGWRTGRHRAVASGARRDEVVLHVPISNGQYFRLRRADRIEDDFVDVPYDDSLGLNLNLPDEHS